MAVKFLLKISAGFQVLGLLIPINIGQGLLKRGANL